MLRNTSRKIPVLGKHTKRIRCGAWSKQNVLALGSDDSTLTISNTEGDTVTQLNIQGIPDDMQFSEMKGNDRSVGENTVRVQLLQLVFFLPRCSNTIMKLKSFLNVVID